MDLETRLRDGLTALAEPVRPTVEADALFVPGEQLRRRRRLGVVAGATASVLVIALALGSLPWLRGTPAPVVVATPSPTATASTTATASVKPTPSNRTAIKLSQASGGMIDRVEASVVVLDNGLWVTLYLYGPGDLLLHSWSGQATADRRFEVASDIGMRLRIGVLAHQAQDLNLVAAESVPGRLRWGSEQVRGGGGTFYAVFAEGGTDPQLADILWRDTYGQYFTATNKELTTAQVALGTYSGWLYLDSARKVIRYRLGAQANRLNLGESAMDCHFSSDSDDNGTTTSFEICLLPKGANNQDPRLGPAGEHWEIYGLEDWDVLVVTGTGDEPSALLESVIYYLPGRDLPIEDVP